MLLDRDGTILFINRTVPGLSREEVVGTPVYNYTPPEFYKVASDCFKRVLETGKPDSYGTEYRTKEGELQCFEVRVRAEEALVQRVEDLESFNRLAIGREMRMIELKRQINELSEQLGKEPPYDLSVLGE